MIFPSEKGEPKGSGRALAAESWSQAEHCHILLQWVPLILPIFVWVKAEKQLKEDSSHFCVGKS